MKRILIVEDQVDIRELVSMTLELEDYDVHEAENGDQGLVAAQALAPDLMLLDVMMPGSIDGIEVCRRLKADARTRKIKIIILSAKGRIRIAFRVGEAGADDYLTKPFSPETIAGSGSPPHLLIPPSRHVSPGSTSDSHSA